MNPDAPEPQPTASPIDDPLVITDDMLAPAQVIPITTDRRAGRLDFERGMSYAPLVSLAIVVACIGVFVWELTTGALADRESIVAAGALHRPSVFEQGEWWRIGSAMFIHGGVDHLLGNMIALYIVGMALEHGLGALRMLIVYLVSGVVGGVFSLTFQSEPSVGASGAIFGITGAVVVFLWRHRGRYYIRDGQIGIVLAVWAGYQLLIGMLNPQIDNICHLGGIMGGSLLPLMLKPRQRLT